MIPSIRGGVDEGGDILGEQIALGGEGFGGGADLGEEGVAGAVAGGDGWLERRGPSSPWRVAGDGVRRWMGGAGSSRGRWRAGH